MFPDAQSARDFVELAVELGHTTSHDAGGLEKIWHASFVVGTTPWGEPLTSVEVRLTKQGCYGFPCRG